MNLPVHPDSAITAESYRLAIREIYKQSLSKLCVHLLGYKDVKLRTHGQIVKNLEGPTQRKLIVVPRGSLKSSIGVVGYSIWSLVRNPDLRILIDSELYGNSKNFIREIKQHMEGEALTSIFGTFKTETNWSEGEITIAQRAKKIKEASITAGGVETTKVGQHYDIIICDDLNSNKNSLTPEAREKVIRHYQMQTSILEPDGIMVIIGTRYAQNDVIGFIIENELTDEQREVIAKV